MDGWTPKQIIFMENGGNVRAHDYFKKHGAVFGNVIDYKHQAVQKYKQELERKVLSIKNYKVNLC